MGSRVIHLLKLSVGTRDVAGLAEWQALRGVTDPPLRHQTRQKPKRSAEIEDGGSIYWVITGFVRVRQRILEIRDEAWDDGTSCAGLVLHPELIPVAARPVKPFQGWRYLAPEAAPPDIDPMAAAAGIDALPAELREALRALGLL
ncbi:hypothetical protein C8P66_12277 [Humitalea rosea]|uniref:DUF1489 family protein n=1 Tax=Humitalea rosea TaxID=990373 RepID=A0A2W7K0E7_9PROT|nr:hypothetical protein C8P66_12277 [Humitalea rosea]